MHPEMLPSLVAERHRDIAASVTGCRATAKPGRAVATGPARGARGAARRRPLLRVSWSRVTLAARAGDPGGRRRSWVIIISASRPL
jgi:hypothetical protein